MKKGFTCVFLALFLLSQIGGQVMHNAFADTDQGANTHTHTYDSQGNTLDDDIWEQLYAEDCYENCEEEIIHTLERESEGPQHEEELSTYEVFLDDPEKPIEQIKTPHTFSESFSHTQNTSSNQDSILPPGYLPLDIQYIEKENFSTSGKKASFKKGLLEEYFP